MTPSLLLRGARVALTAGSASFLDILISDRRIQELAPSVKCPRESVILNLEGKFILPGLVNAHDHLEFGLFSRLGRGVYPDARLWAKDIYHPQESPLREILQVPKATRLFWGGLKNLLAGVTTVCHHNPYEPEVFERDFPVRVLRHYGWSHSLAFSPNVRQEFENAPPQTPFLIHVAEGTTEDSRSEIEELDRMGLLGPRTVLIHGVALTLADWNRVRNRKASLVWCPSSNLFTLGKTVELSVLRGGIKTALGNDSPLTAAGDLLDEIRCARRLGAAAEEIYSWVGLSAAAVLRLTGGEGRILKDGIADLVITRDTGDTPAQRLACLSQREIEIVIIGGEIMLVSAQAASLLPLSLRGQLQPLIYDDSEYEVNVDVRQHWRQTLRVLQEPLRIAGRVLRVIE